VNGVAAMRSANAHVGLAGLSAPISTATRSPDAIYRPARTAPRGVWRMQRGEIVRQTGVA